MKKNSHKIITGDIVSSEQLEEEQRDSLYLLMRDLAQTSASTYDFFVRGDSFQILVRGNALKETLGIQALLHYKLNIQARIAIGIGKAEYLKEKLSDSDGEAFRLSGRGLDKIKEENKLFGVFTNHDISNEEWDIHTAVLDYFFRNQTRNQSEAIYWMLKGYTQTEIAHNIGKSQSSINARIKSSGWEIIKKITDKFNTL